MAAACSSAAPAPDTSPTPGSSASATATPSTASRPTPPPTASAGPAATPTATAGSPSPAGTAVAPYAVAVDLPAGWSRTDDPGAARFEGDGGYLELDALSTAGSAHDGCEQLAHHTLQPYGSEPTIEDRTVDGQEGCVVRPSDDQPAEMHGEAAAVAAYPSPVTIEGDTPGEPAHTYDYLVVYADGDHLDALLASLTFTG